MNHKNIIQGNLQGEGQKIAIILGRFNHFIGDALEKGAHDVLLRHGVKENDIQLIYVPGAFEIPLAALKVAQSKKYQGVIALGAVIRGATPHFDYVAGECVKGLSKVQLDTGIPVGFGVLTVDSIEQAIERAGTKAGNKGAEAALTVLEMIHVLSQL